MAGDTVLYEQEYYSVGGGFIEWKGYQPPKKGQPKYPYSTMEELQAHAREEQALDRAGRHGQRGGGLRQERGGDQRLHRQDHDRDGQHRQGRPEGAAVARCPARSSSRPRPATSTSARWTTSTRGSAASASCGLRAGGLGGERRGHLVVTAPTGGSAGVMPALVYALGEGGRKLPQEKIRDGIARRGGGRLSVQAQRDAVRRRRRLPGGDRRRLGDGRGVPRAGARLPASRSWRTPRSRRCSITSA